jgi:hypothetical protein
MSWQSWGTQKSSRTSIIISSSVKCVAHSPGLFYWLWIIGLLPENHFHIWFQPSSQISKGAGGMVFWNVGILPQHYTASQPRRPQLQSSNESNCRIVIPFFFIVELLYVSLWASRRNYRCWGEPSASWNCRNVVSKGSYSNVPESHRER